MYMSLLLLSVCSPTTTPALYAQFITIYTNVKVIMIKKRLRVKCKLNCRMVSSVIAMSSIKCLFINYVNIDTDVVDRMVNCGAVDRTKIIMMADLCERYGNY